MRVLDLFSGIGGFSLGLERAGMRTVAFCECDPYCRAVLAKHWPDVPCYDDVRTLTAARLAADEILATDVADAASRWTQRRRGNDCQHGRGGEGTGEERIQVETGGKGLSGIDLICGGFPCQDISVAGKGAGLAGERSGLWSEYARIIGEVRPRYALIENVAILTSRGLDRILCDLAALGMSCEWHCIPASAVGAPHRRDRVWIVAYAAGNLWRTLGNEIAYALNWSSVDVAHPQSERERSGSTSGCDGSGGEQLEISGARGNINNGSEALANADQQQMGRLAIAWGECDHWLVEPDVGRVAHGVPNRVDRLKALGNAVVPQIPEIIGRAIMALETSQ